MIAEQVALIEEMGESVRSLVAEAEDLLADGLVIARHVLVVGRRM